MKPIVDPALAVGEQNATQLHLPSIMYTIGTHVYDYRKVHHT